MQPRIQVAEPELSLNPGGLPFSTPSGSVPTMGFNDRKKKTHLTQIQSDQNSEFSK